MNTPNFDTIAITARAGGIVGTNELLALAHRLITEHRPDKLMVSIRRVAATPGHDVVILLDNFSGAVTETWQVEATSPAPELPECQANTTKGV